MRYCSECHFSYHEFCRGAIFQIGVVRFAVSWRYLWGIEKAQPFCKAAPLGGVTRWGIAEELFLDKM